MKTSDINEFKGIMKDAIADWAENKIDALFPSKANTRAIIKKGVNNILARMDSKINGYIDTMVLFLGDAKGNIDSDTMIDMAVSVFEEMDKSEFDLGICGVRVGKGELFVDLPHNMLMDMLVGNLGSVRFSSEDLKEFKNYLN